MLFLFNTVVSGFLLNEYIRTRYPREHMNFCIMVMYYGVYSISKVQLTLNKLFAKLKTNRGSQSKDIVEFVLDGEVICVTNKEDVVRVQPDSFDFIIYTEKDCKRIIDNLLEEFVCEDAGIKFILVEIEFGDVKMKIDFKPTPKDNFYVVGNTFHPKFIHYLMKKYYAVDVFPDKYKLKILDHSVNSIELDETMCINIEKDRYQLINL